MMVAHVVPLRRFPSDHPWFDYRLPTDSPAKPGQLVEVPFLRQQVPGIIWDLASHSSIKRLKLISRILRLEPVMTPWQRRVCATMADQGAVSLGHILDSVIPNYPRRTVEVPPPDGRAAAAAVQPPVPPVSTWWYRQRQQALSWTRSWMVSSDTKPRLVVVPTVEDGQQLIDLIQPDLPGLVFVHSRLSRTAYAAIYDGVRHGLITRVIGTVRGLTLPYPVRPSILIDQEEHPAHKQSEQQPRLDTRRILEVVAPDALATTPAPSLRRWYQQPLIPPPTDGQRQLASLQQTSGAPWMSAEFHDRLSRLAADRRQLLVIAPQRGYASSMSCRDCFLTLACQHCHHRLRLIRQDRRQTVCQDCGQRQTLPSVCPRCHGTTWDVHGWGVEQVAEGLRRLWPTLSIATAGDQTADCLVDTYRAYRQARQLRRLSATVIISGDALLNHPDFSVAERAWQYLARVQAEVPTMPLIVQTFVPENDFWQRWRPSDDRAWYTTELAARQRHALPPITDQWIARYPGPQAAAMIAKKILAIDRLGLSGLTAVVLPPGGRRRAEHDRLLLTSRRRPLAQLLPGRQLFPYPWQLDTSVTSWLP